MNFIISSFTLLWDNCVNIMLNETLYSINHSIIINRPLFLQNELELIKFAKSRPSLKKLMCVGGSDTFTERERERAAAADVFDYDAGTAALMDRVPTRPLDLIHFIVGHGILRRSLRCELCKGGLCNDMQV